MKDIKNFYGNFDLLLIFNAFFIQFHYSLYVW